MDYENIIYFIALSQYFHLQSLFKYKHPKYFIVLWPTLIVF